MTAPEPADLARQHGAPWAKQLTEDELMKIEQYDFGASDKPATVTAWQFVMAALCAILVALIIATVTAQIVMSADVYGLVR